MDMKETKIEYMKRRLKELREMNPEKILPLQRDFPNCGKYEDCCTKDEKFWDNLQERVKEINPKKQPLRIKKVNLEFTKTPEGFEEYSEEILRILEGHKEC